VSQLVLGTAQFGSGYGITNSQGRLNDHDLAKVLELALDSGVTRLDTAAVYGDALDRLRAWATDFSITAKVVGTDPVDPVEQIQRSLSRIGLDQFHSCLVREWDGLNERARDRVVERMIDAQDQQLIERIGIAAYSREDVLSFRAHMLRAGGEVGAVQVPANPLDRRLDGDKDVLELALSGAEVAVRSIFLQGVLLEEGTNAFRHHPHVGRYWDYVHSATAESALHTCIAHIRALPWAQQVVVGVTSILEWKGVVRAWDEVQPDPAPYFLASDDLRLLDPRQWRQ